MGERAAGVDERFMSACPAELTSSEHAERTLRLVQPDPATDSPVRGDLPPASLYERYGKRIVDLVCGVTLLVLTLPVMVAAAIAIRVHLGPGVISRQTRLGRHARPFTILKFRTMWPDRGATSLPFDGIDRRLSHKRDNDPRHTRLGRILRRTRVDELPQFWNVVRGDMSMVGPRPELVPIVDRYEPWQHRRHDVKPGITGFWQISEHANGLAYQGIEHDLHYLRRISFITDCRVLGCTVAAVLRRGGR